MIEDAVALRHTMYNNVILSYFLIASNQYLPKAMIIATTNTSRTQSVCIKQSQDAKRVNEDCNTNSNVCKLGGHNGDSDF